jgi:arylsulfatase A-like enzyme
MEPTIPGSMYREMQTYAGQHWIVNRFGGDSQYHADWWGFRDRRVQLLFYEFIHRQTLRMAADPAFGVVFAHYPVPHPLGIFDRHTNQTGLEFRYNYIDNFELADRALQEVREALESAGLGDSTTLLVSSDHPFRPETWSKREVWTEEEAQISDGTKFTRIPFLLKLHGHESGVEYEQPFNTILSTDLLLDILSGAVNSPEEVVSWLDDKRETVRLEALHTSD